VLAYYPHAAEYPIRTLEVRIRPEGDVVHTYARMNLNQHHYDHYSIKAEVFASLIYTPQYRRVIDLSFRDNGLPHRDCNRTAEIVTQYNNEFERRDPLEMRHRAVGPQMDELAPRSRHWIWCALQGDHGWHAFQADDYIEPGVTPSEFEVLDSAQAGPTSDLF
jgi:hypothetical protein